MTPQETAALGTPDRWTDFALREAILQQREDDEVEAVWNPAEAAGCALSLAIIVGSAAGALEMVKWVVRVIWF